MRNYLLAVLMTISTISPVVSANAEDGAWDKTKSGIKESWAGVKNGSEKAWNGIKEGSKSAWNDSEKSRHEIKKESKSFWQSVKDVFK
jgi:hypothetical protein